METRFKPEELFEGALIRQHDRNTYTAAITKIQGDWVDVVDVSTWGKTLNRPVASIKPADLNDGSPLRHLGFLRDGSSVTPKYQLGMSKGMLTVFQEGLGWVLTDGRQSTPVLYAHQVQTVCKQLFGFCLNVAPLGNEQSSDDYYIE